MKSLHDLYYDPVNGYCSLRKFIVIGSKHGYSRADVVDFYDSQMVNQIYRKPVKSNIPYRSDRPGRIIADLIDISLFSRVNGGNKWILTLIDVQSRHGWAFPMKNKKPESVLEHLKDLDVDMKTFTTDKGSEFMGVVAKWLKSKKIEQWISPLKGRTNLVELFNKIVITKLFRIMKHQGNHRWVDVLDSVVEGYNADKPLGSHFHERELIDPFSIGDYVRIPYKGQQFMAKNAREQKWSDEIYRIVSMDHARYVVIDDKYKSLDMSYLPRQLLAVKPYSTIGSTEMAEEMAEIKKKVKFVRAQRKSGLDVDADGNVIIPKALRIK